MDMKWIFTALGGILFFVLIYVWFYGGFSRVKIAQKEIGPYTLCYDFHQGDYSKIGTVMDRVFDDLKKKDNLSTTLGFGLFYDKPGFVEKDELRSIGGCILPRGFDPVSLTSGYSISEFPKTSAIVCEFPYKGMASVIFGVMKVYPALNKYIKENHIPDTPLLEIYDIPNKKIVYAAPIGLEPDLLLNFLD